MTQTEFEALVPQEKWEFYEESLEELRDLARQLGLAESALERKEVDRHWRVTQERQELYTWVHELHGGVERDSRLCIHPTCQRVREILPDENEEQFFERRQEMPKKVTAEQARAKRLLGYVKKGMSQYPEAADSMQPALAFAEGLVERQGEDEADEQHINWEVVAVRVNYLDTKLARSRSARIGSVVRAEAEDVIKRFREGERTRELAEQIAEVAL